MILVEAAFLAIKLRIATTLYRSMLPRLSQGGIRPGPHRNRRFVMCSRLECWMQRCPQWIGRHCEFGVICQLIRTRAGRRRSSSIRDVAGPRGRSTREGRQSGGRSLVGATRRASWGRQEAGRHPGRAEFAEESVGTSVSLRLAPEARGPGSAARRWLSPVLASEARANAVKVAAAACEARS